MRTSNKSRSRNKNNNNNNRRQNPSNVINRVFDSSGPEGRVRGTPQQIIDKYQSLASDAMLSGDRIAHENFLQHSEHYSRLLVLAQREMDAKKEQQQQQQQSQKHSQPQPQNTPPSADSSEQPTIDARPDQDVFPGQTNESALVETPEAATESSAPKKNRRRPSKPREEQPAVQQPTKQDNET